VPATLDVDRPPGPTTSPEAHMRLTPQSVHPTARLSCPRTWGSDSGGGLCLGVGNSQEGKPVNKSWSRVHGDHSN